MSALVYSPEPEDVDKGDRPRAHREDVSEDPADPGRGAAVGVHGGGVVVALDVERHHVAVAHVDHTGVIAGAEHDPLASGREEPEEGLGGLVAAVLGPFSVDYRPLYLVGLPSQAPPHVL